MEQETKQAIRFGGKIEINTLKELGKILKAPEFSVSEELCADYEEEIGVMDPSNCVMVIARTEPAKRCLSRFIDSEEHKTRGFQRIPDLKYDKIGNGKFSNTFLLKAIKLLDASYENVHIKESTDYPITIYNEQIGRAHV